MKKYLLTCGAIISLVYSANAADLYKADEQFMAKAEALGISQAVWDQAEYTAATFPNAYKFTRYYEIGNGSSGSGKGTLVPEKWKETNSLDLSKLKGTDADGEFPLPIILRDRLKNHAMVVLKGNELVHQHYWNGMDKNSTHLDMSVTKSFTAILAGIAADEGKLDMSKPIEHYLPYLKGTAFEGATVQVVADMRSGLNIPTPEHKSWDPRFTESQEWNGKNDSGLNGISEYLVLIKDRKYPVGQRYQYQDPNTEALGLATEAGTGIKLADYLEEKIWKRIGAENKAFWMADPSGFVVASGGLNITTRDLARVGRVILNDGKNYKGEQLIPKAFLDALWEGNDEVRSAWKGSKEEALVTNAWYKDQFRVININGHKLLCMVGIHGQVLAMEKTSGIVVAMNGGYTQTETPRSANLIFYQVLPAILDELK